MPDAKISLDPSVFTEEDFVEAISEKLDPAWVVCFYLYTSCRSESTGVFEPKISTLTYMALPGKLPQDGLKIYNYLLSRNKYLEFVTTDGKRYTYIPAYLKINTLNHPRKPVLPFPPRDWCTETHYKIAEKWGINLEKMKTRKPKKELTIFDNDNTENNGQDEGQKEVVKKEKPIENKDKVDPKPKTEKPEEKKESVPVKEPVKESAEETPEKVLATSEDRNNKMIEIMDFWNKTQLPHITKLTDNRKSKLRARLKEKEFIVGWKDAIVKLSESEYCINGNWATFDWLVQNDNNYIKTLEGKYDNKSTDKYELNPDRKPDIKDYIGKFTDPRQRIKAYQKDLAAWNEKYGDKKQA